MKNHLLIVFCFLLVNVTVKAQNLDNATINKIKVKYMTAETSYNNKNYSEALNKTLEIEELSGGQLIPTSQNLKIKALIGLGKYLEANDALEKLQQLELSDDILKDMSSYTSKIETEVKKQKVQLVENKKRMDKAIFTTESEFGIITTYQSNGELDYYLIVNKSGELVYPKKLHDITKISPTTFGIKDYVEGHSSSFSPGKQGIINSKGQIILSVKYLIDMDFYPSWYWREKEGWIKVQDPSTISDYTDGWSDIGLSLIVDPVKKKEGMIDAYGNIKVPIKFEMDSIDVLENGKAYAILNGKYIKINRYGQVVN